MKSDRGALKQRMPFWEREGFQSVMASLICIFIGLLIGYMVLLMIDPSEATGNMLTILKNFFTFPRKKIAIEYLGNTLVKTAPLLMCALSIIFAHKVGLFNIGASGQYTIGAGLSLYLALGLKMPWFICLVAAVAGGALWGALAGVLKIYFNVSEVISGIMMNWISLYSVNMLLTGVQESSNPFTIMLRRNADRALLPNMGLDHLFAGNQYVTIAIPVAVIMAALVWFIFEKTKMGYEFRATGLNIDAAKYAGMNAQRNIIGAMAIAGGLAALGAVFLFLSGIEQWNCDQIAVPVMGFNGIAAAFLGGLHPIGAVFSSYFIQHITSGGVYINRMVFSSKISDMIVAIIIYSCSFAFFFKYCFSKWKNRRKKASDNTKTIRSKAREEKQQ